MEVFVFRKIVISNVEELLSKNEKRAVFFLEYLKNLSECSPKRKIAT
jgi:hypothetical protein